MRVRLIVECDPKDLGQILSAMPSRVQWHATSATYTPAPKPHSITAQVVEALPKPKRQPPTHRSRAQITSIKNQMVGHLAANPGARWIDLVNFAMRLGINRGHAPGIVLLLKKEGRIVARKDSRNYSTYTVAKAPNGKSQQS